MITTDKPQVIKLVLTDQQLGQVRAFVERITSPLAPGDGYFLLSEVNVEAGQIKILGWIGERAAEVHAILGQAIRDISK